MRRIGLGVVTVVALVIPADRAAACSADQATFEAAIAGASAVARVVIEDVSEYGEPWAGETFRIVRVLKGELPDRVHLDDPRTGICGDTIGGGGPGREAIVAFGLPLFGRIVNPAWFVVDHPLRPVSGAGVTTPDGVTSLDELEETILAALPDTAITAAGSRHAALIGGWLLLLAAALMALRRLRPT